MSHYFIYPGINVHFYIAIVVCGVGPVIIKPAIPTPACPIILRKIEQPMTSISAIVPINDVKSQPLGAL